MSEKNEGKRIQIKWNEYGNVYVFLLRIFYLDPLEQSDELINNKRTFINNKTDAKEREIMLKI